VQLSIAKRLESPRLLRYLQHAASILGETHQHGGGSVAFWRKKRIQFDEMDRIIREEPGIRPAELARRLDVARSTVTRRLPSMEEAGYRYAEDEEGGLWPFSPAEF
jgi:DNA-binding transcriptional ArsR family regulator